MSGPLANGLLRLLPSATRARMAAVLKRVRLERQQVLFRAHEPLTVVYFPVTAVVSLIARAETGQSLEIGIIGSDGVVGVGVCPGVSTMPCDALTLVAGDAYQLSPDALQREVAADPEALRVFGGYAEWLFVRCMQLSVCNMFHPVEQRCVRSLLTLHDLIAEDDIPLTHELLASLLGVHRPTVTLAFGALARAGAIQDLRGRVVVVDRSRLEAASCECYGFLRDQHHRLFGVR
jgi:CRP-like cAMP-binding protein